MITRKAKKYEQQLSRRSAMIGGLQLVLTAGLVGRLFYLQVRESRHYEALADQNKFDFHLLPPSRGRIFDSHGRLLAGNADAYELNVIPRYTDDLKKTLISLAQLIELDETNILELLDKARKQRAFIPLTVRKDLTHREVARVAVRSPELPGVQFDHIQKRIYPQGLLTGHLTGYVGRASEKDVSEGRILPEMVSLRNGKSGIEHSFERILRGTPGQERIVVNAFGRPIRKSIDQPATAGSDIRLSIDINLQAFAANTLRRGQNRVIERQHPEVIHALATDAELAAAIPESENIAIIDEKGRIAPPESGSAIVMEVETGYIKAMISTPTFDPNLLADSVSQNEWEKLTNHPRTPMLDRAVKGQYAPGSTFKMIAALAALEAGIIDTRSTFTCPGHKQLGNGRFHCWKKGGHGRIGLIEALEQSCDVFFYELSLRAGIDSIAAMAKKFGLGQLTGIDVPGEKAGLMPDREWKEKAIGEPWTPGETVISAIGQGYVLMTPIQLAVMTARIANGGKAVSPRLVVDGRPPWHRGHRGHKENRGLGISQASLQIIKRGMERVVDGEQGTARFSRLDLDGVAMAGKTGTVQVRRISKAERDRGVIKNIDRPWKFRDHALFVGYAPADKPKYAIAVVVEHGGSGSTTAAPIARDIFTYLFEQEL